MGSVSRAALVARTVALGGGGLTLDGDLPRLCSVELRHAGNLLKRDKVPVLESVSGLVQAGDHSLLVL